MATIKSITEDRFKEILAEEGLTDPDLQQKIWDHRPPTLEALWALEPEHSEKAARYAARMVMTGREGQ